MVKKDDKMTLVLNGDVLLGKISFKMKNDTFNINRFELLHTLSPNFYKNKLQ